MYILITCGHIERNQHSEFLQNGFIAKIFRVFEQAYPYKCLSIMPIEHGGDRSIVIVPRWWGSKRISRWSFLTKNISAAATTRSSLRSGSSVVNKSYIVSVSSVIPDMLLDLRKLQHFSFLVYGTDSQFKRKRRGGKVWEIRFIKKDIFCLELISVAFIIDRHIFYKEDYMRTLQEFMRWDKIFLIIQFTV